MRRDRRCVFGLCALLLLGCGREPARSPLSRLEASSAAQAWLEELKTLFPLEDASFQLTGTDPLRAEAEPWLRLWDEQASGEDIEALKSLAERSPDGSRAVSLFYENVYRTDAGWEPGGNPDSYIALLPLDTWVGTALFMCGTPCRFHAAGWAGADSVVVVGMYENPPEVWHLEAGLLDLDARRVHWYRGPEVPASMRSEVEKKWLAWLRKRYPLVSWAGH